MPAEGCQVPNSFIGRTPRNWYSRDCTRRRCSPFRLPRDDEAFRADLARPIRLFRASRTEQTAPQAYGDGESLGTARGARPSAGTSPR